MHVSESATTVIARVNPVAHISREYQAVHRRNSEVGKKTAKEKQILLNLGTRAFNKMDSKTHSKNQNCVLRESTVKLGTI